jgi:hypothetical protein
MMGAEFAIYAWLLFPAVTRARRVAIIALIHFGSAAVIGNWP